VYVNEKLKSAAPADGGKCGNPFGPGVGRLVTPKAVPLTVPLPLPSKVRMPSTIKERLYDADGEVEVVPSALKKSRSAAACH
jgi:hypothetical protein